MQTRLGSKKADEKSVMRQTRDIHNGLIAELIDAWRNRSPYTITKKISVVGGSVFAAVALWMAVYGSGIEGLVLYGFASMFFFMWWYAITHL